MSGFLDAAHDGDLERVKQLVAEGGDVAEAGLDGITPYLRAASRSYIPIMHWLLIEGGSSLAEQDLEGTRALLMAARSAHFPAMLYLVEEQGASLTECDTYGRTVWSRLGFSLSLREIGDAAELRS
jgi:ankyrin repeat protein